MSYTKNPLSGLYEILSSIRSQTGRPIFEALNFSFEVFSEQDSTSRKNPFYGVGKIFELLSESNNLLDIKRVLHEERPSLKKLSSFFLATSYQNDVVIFNNSFVETDFQHLRVLARVVDDLGDNLDFDSFYLKIKKSIENAVEEIDNFDIEDEVKSSLIDILYGFLRGINMYKWEGKKGLFEELDKFFGKSWRVSSRANGHQREVFAIFYGIFLQTLVFIDYANNVEQLPETIKSIQKILGI